MTTRSPSSRASAQGSWQQLKRHPCWKFCTGSGERRWELERPCPNYYVARLWEDLLLLRWALQEPVSDDLIPFAEGSFERRESPDAFGAEVDAAFDLQTDYWMYLGYLTDSPDLIFWRHTVAGQDVVTLSQQIPPGSRTTFAGPDRLDVVVSGTEFFDAVKDLDRRLFAAMEDRVVELESTGPPPGVELDVAHLRIEHGQRSRWLQLRLDSPRQVDWARVRAGVAEIMSWPPYEDEGD